MMAAVCRPAPSVSASARVYTSRFMRMPPVIGRDSGSVRLPARLRCWAGLFHGRRRDGRPRRPGRGLGTLLRSDGFRRLAARPARLRDRRLDGDARVDGPRPRRQRLVGRRRRRARAAAAADVGHRSARRPCGSAVGPALDDAGDGCGARPDRARRPPRGRPVVDLRLGVPARARRHDLRPGA